MSDRPSLSVLMSRYGTDKLHAHHYDGEYATHFGPLRDRPVRILEIGIGGYNAPGRGGESLKVWRDYFPNGWITGIDIEDKSFLSGPRIATLIADQSQPGTLRDLSATFGPFDIVIDDGSHVQEHILTGFDTLFPLLRPGGIYVIEDLETSYREDYGGDKFPLEGNSWGPKDPPTTSIELLAFLIDGLHWQFWRGRTPTDLQRMVRSVHVSKELAFIYKAQCARLHA